MFDLIMIEDDCEKVFIYYNGIKVGKLNYYYTKDIVKINYILIFDEYKRQGIATKFIRYIREQHENKCIYGDALPEAVKFWKKMGAEFSDPFPSKIKPEVLLTPFKII
jgi:GNAT superfamily N-acetyltransferase